MKGMWKRLAMMLAALVFFTSSALAVTLDGYVKPTYPDNADVYDSAHPELLNGDMLLASSAILMEAKTGTVIFEKNADVHMFPASTTKIMTVYLGLLTSELDETVTVSPNAVELPDDSSVIPLKAGEQLTMESLLYSTMIRSGNDGAIAIAEAVSGSVDAFVNLMNSQAQMMGCTNTHFTNPHGLHDDNHYTTARDLATMTRYAMQNETFAQIAGTWQWTKPRTNTTAATSMTSGKSYIMSPTTNLDGKYYYPYCFGVKTGTTGKAGYCFVGYAKKDGIDLISVVLYSSEAGRWTDTIRLFDYGFAQYVAVTPEELYDMFPFTVQTSGYALDDPQQGKLSLRLVKQGDESVTIVTTQDEVENLARELRSMAMISYTDSFSAPVHMGDVMGTLTYYDERTSKTVIYDLVAAREVAKRANAPKTLAEIEAETLADPNPFPPLTTFGAVLLVLFIGVLVGIIKLLRSLLSRKKHTKRNKTVKAENRMYR